MITRVRIWAHALKRDALTLWLAARDPRVRLLPKILAAAVAAYAFSPIDLIPDFIPVLGLVDDLLIVPVGVWLVLRLVPPPVIAELRRRAAALARRPTSPLAAVLVIAVWAAAAFAVWRAVM